MIVGGGDIDLNTEKLNIEFNTKPRKGVGVSGALVRRHRQIRRALR
jgi:hypothetical protein